MTIRVLVCDDSGVMRRLITSALTTDPSIEVVGVAASGRLALQRIAELDPDVVTLDVEMPEMTGLEALVALRAAGDHVPVLMLSSLTVRGALVTIDCLVAGADDYAAKPSHAANAEAATAQLAAELVRKVKALASRPRTGRPRPLTVHDDAPSSRAIPPSAASAPSPSSSSAPAASAALAFPRASREPVSLVAIGTSTGGPVALAEVLRGLAATLPVPIVVVQHMPPVFTKYLADRLTAELGFPVHEAKDGDRLTAGAAWLAPGDFHMEVQRDGTRVVARLHQGPAVNSCRPSVDVLFRSVAAVYGGGALAVVLTGMGDDGRRGCEWLKREGAAVIAQDEASSVVWGMPGSVVKAGLADDILPLAEVAAAIRRRVAARRVSP